MHLMRRFGFGEKQRKWIRLCDSQFFFLINGRPYSLEVQRALRQGDILFSLLFILVIKLFSIMLHKNVGVGYVTGFQVEGGEVMVSTIWNSLMIQSLQNLSRLGFVQYLLLCSRQYQVKGNAAMEDGFSYILEIPLFKNFIFDR